MFFQHTVSTYAVNSTFNEMCSSQRQDNSVTVCEWGMGSTTEYRPSRNRFAWRMNFEQIQVIANLRISAIKYSSQPSPPWKSQIVQRLREIDILTDKVSAVHTKHHGAFVLSYN